MTKGVIVQFISLYVKKLELYCLICQYISIYTSSINLSFIIVLVNHEPTSQTTR